MLGREGDDPVAAVRRLLERALERPVERLGRASGEGEAAAVQPDRLLDLLARDLDRRRGLAAPARGECGLANFSSIHGRIASATSGATGVVAW